MLRDALCVGADDGGIRPIGGEATAPEPLFAATVKDLVVGREKPARACGGDLELYARAAELAPGDALLDDSTLCGELAHVCGWADTVHAGDQALEALLDQRSLPAC